MEAIILDTVEENNKYVESRREKAEKWKAGLISSLI